MTVDVRAAIEQTQLAHTISTADETCCSCGHWFNDDSGPIEFQHASHVADALVAVVVQAQADALRDAANALTAEAEAETKRTKWDGMAGTLGNWIHGWREAAKFVAARADALTPTKETKETTDE